MATQQGEDKGLYWRMTVGMEKARWEGDRSRARTSHRPYYADEADWQACP